MDSLPLDVLCVILHHVAVDARSVGEVLRLGQTNKRWRAAVHQPFVWSSWGGVAAARRAACIERNWAASPPQSQHNVTLCEYDDSGGGEHGDGGVNECVRIATNGRFTLLLSRTGPMRILTLERSGIVVTVWPVSGNFELADACISTRGDAVAWISHRERHSVRVLSCALVNRPVPHNVTVFRSKYAQKALFSCFCQFHDYVCLQTF